jgi:2-iminobutanoate/2-iminopropanoate deaminase
MLSTMKQTIQTQKAPQAIGPYSQAVVSNNMVFVSGQIPLSKDNMPIEGTIEEKTHQVMKNIGEILLASGVSFSDVVKVTMYLTDIENFKRINAIYSEYMLNPYPARETVAVKSLPLNAEIEMSVIAIKN